MFFRRISQHIKEQNWTAIGLDFAIVVLGVFLAFQLSSWSDRLGEDQRRTEILEQLLDEYNEIVADTQRIVEVNTEQLELAISLLELIRGEDTPELNEEVERMFYLSMIAYRPPRNSETYRELIATGALTGLLSKDLNAALSSHQSTWTAATVNINLLADILNRPAMYRMVRFNLRPGGRYMSEIERIDWDLVRQAEPDLQAALFYRHSIPGYHLRTLESAQDVVRLIKVDLGE